MRTLGVGLESRSFPHVACPVVTHNRISQKVLEVLPEYVQGLAR